MMLRQSMTLATLSWALAGSALALDTSHCLRKQYFTPAESEAFKDQYFSFHRPLTLPEEEVSNATLIEEAGHVLQMVNLQKCLMDARYKETGEYKRGFHAKSHGCATANIELLGTGTGVFSQLGSFEGVVRFSNGSTTVKADSDRDIRGLAVKIFESGIKPMIDSSGAKDFDLLLINARNVPSANFKEFMDVIKLGEGLLSIWEKIKVTTRLLTSGLAHKLLIKTPDVKAIDYHSAVPYRYGSSQVVKYRMRHVACKSRKPLDRTPTSSESFLAENLREDLKTGPLCFDLQAQVRDQDDPDIGLDRDNSTWEGDDFKTIGRVIMNGTMGPGRCEALQFNPWHAPKDHRPIGSISRARSHVYEHLSNYRLADRS